MQREIGDLVAARRASFDDQFHGARFYSLRSGLPQACEPRASPAPELPVGTRADPEAPVVGHQIEPVELRRLSALRAPGANQFASSASRDSCGPPVSGGELHAPTCGAPVSISANADRRAVRSRRPPCRSGGHDQRIATVSSAARAMLGLRRVRRGRLLPAPHNHSADTRRSAARSRAALNAAPCSHISISVQSRREARRRRARGSAGPMSAFRASRAGSTRARRAGADNPLSRKAALAAVVQLSSCGPKARANSSRQLARSALVRRKQPAIGKPHVIEPRFQRHGRRQPGVAATGLGHRCVRTR